MLQRDGGFEAGAMEYGAGYLDLRCIAKGPGAWVKVTMSMAVDVNKVSLVLNQLLSNAKQGLNLSFFKSTASGASVGPSSSIGKLRWQEKQTI